MSNGSGEKTQSASGAEVATELHVFHAAVLVISLFFFIWMVAGYGTSTGEALRDYLGEMGWKGVVVYIVFFVIGSFLFFSSTALSVIAPALFGPWQGFAAIIAGNMAAVASIFWVTRWAGIHWGFLKRAQGRIPKRLIKITEGRGVLFVFYARLMMLPASLVNYSTPLLSISFSESILGTFLGILPHCLSTALSIGILRDAVLEGTPASLMRWELGLLALAYGTTFLTARWLRNRVYYRG